MLLCEISSPSIFQLPHPRLIENVERIFKNLLKFDKEVEELIFKYYEDKLHKDKWKKQLGAVHGFVKYLEVIANLQYTFKLLMFFPLFKVTF